MAIVIRTAYNNKDWRGPCDTPGKDPLCFYCFKGLLAINKPKSDDIVCSGGCWEQHICVDHKWGAPPRGRKFGPNAYPGATVFLVFKQPDDNYTIWGKTVISSVDKEVMRSARDYENGFSFIHFDTFDPLSRDKWVTDISDEQLVEARWMMGRHRYINVNQEKYLNRLLEGDIIVLEAPDVLTSRIEFNQADDVVLGATVSPNIYKKLEDIGADEGRSVNELVREAVATWIRNRQ